ncbi:unnamed protein product [Closterium sp. NIES-54]
MGGCGHKVGRGGHLSKRDRCREGGRHRAAADAVLTPAPKPAAAAATAAAAAVPRHCSTPCGWLTSRWLTSTGVTSTSCSRGVTGRCTRRSSSPCTPAAAARHVNPTASAASARTLTALPATPTPRPQRSRKSSCGHVSSGSAEGGSKGGQLRDSAPVEQWRGHNTRGRGYQAEVALDVLEGRLKDLDSELDRVLQKKRVMNRGKAVREASGDEIDSNWTGATSADRQGARGATNGQGARGACDGTGREARRGRDGTGRTARRDGTEGTAGGDAEGTAGVTGRDGTAGATRRQGRRDGTSGRRDGRGDGTGQQGQRDSRGDATAGAAGARARERRARWALRDSADVTGTRVRDRLGRYGREQEERDPTGS